MSLEEMTAKDKNSTLDQRLDDIEFRIGRGSHFESATLPYTNYAIHAIDEDMPWLLAQVRKLSAELTAVNERLAKAESNGIRLTVIAFEIKRWLGKGNLEPMWYDDFIKIVKMFDPDSEIDK